jgi:organic radical activating enzyme
MNFSHEVRIETSTFCNYRCLFCPHVTRSFTRKKEIMSQEKFEFILSKVKEEAPQITDCTISGFGEAFLDKHLVDKVLFARKLGYFVHIVTNGSLITKSFVNTAILNEVSDLRFSLHTLHPKHYEEITGSYYHEHVISIIKYAFIKSRDSKTKIIISAEIVKENKDDVEKLKAFQFADTIEIWKPHNWSDWGKYRNVVHTKNTCGRPFHGPLQIQVDGTVNMCCFDYNGKLLLGDFTSQTLEEIFSGEQYLEIKSHHENGTIKESNLLCKTCDQLMDSGEYMVYSNKYESKERSEMLSTTYEKIT